MTTRDLRKAILKKGGDHSIFSPSSSAGWLFCQDYIFANYGKPDTSTYDTAYGTVGHEVGEVWLKRWDDLRKIAYDVPLRGQIELSCPEFMNGAVRKIKGVSETFEITIDEEMLDHVEKYVRWCAELHGDHFVEVRVDFSDLTPIDGQGGTADHACCEIGKLTITDLKMGMGIKVDAKGNTQALLYAYGFFREYDWIYCFKTIEIRIAQPRIGGGRGHFDTWTITREELLTFAESVVPLAELSWTPGGTRTPGPKQCQWCKDVACAARVELIDAETEDDFDDVSEEPAVIEGEFTVVTRKAMVAKKADLDRADWKPNHNDPATLSTAQLAKLLRHRKMIEKWFKDIEAELEARATNGEEIPWWKLVDGREGNRAFKSEKVAVEWAKKNGISPLALYKAVLLTPAQLQTVAAKQLGVSKEKAGLLLASAVIRAPGRQTLAPVSDERDALDSPGEDFDDLSADDL